MIENFDWNSLLRGIQFLLGLQLIVVAVFHFVLKSSSKRIPLAILCLLLGLWFFKRVFYGYWHQDLFLFILIGPGKPIFAGSVILFYFQMFNKVLQRGYVIKHLVLPALYYLGILVFRFFYPDLFPSIGRNGIPVFSFAALIIFWYYFTITRKVLLTDIKPRLIAKAFKKVMFLFYSLYFFLLQVPFWDMVQTASKNGALGVGMAQLVGMDQFRALLIAGTDFIYLYLHFLGFVLFIFAISELFYFKQLFLPKSIAIDTAIFDNREAIDQKINRAFYENKLFKDSGMNLKTAAEVIGINVSELQFYFKIGKSSSFTGFLNSLRVNEFKLLVNSRSYRHYDLVSLAKECGFKSKSTFYRIFKELEGMTPNEYKKSRDIEY